MAMYIGYRFLEDPVERNLHFLAGKRKRLDNVDGCFEPCPARESFHERRHCVCKILAVELVRMSDIGDRPKLVLRFDQQLLDLRNERTSLYSDA